MGVLCLFHLGAGFADHPAPLVDFTLDVIAEFFRRLADRFGAKRIFMMAIVLYAASSSLCGFAVTLPQLIAARLLHATLPPVFAAAAPPFAAIWRAVFDGGLAPGGRDEGAAVLRPPIALRLDERELLAATAELHDSALAAPTVPDKADISALLAAVLPPLGVA
jgi:hypothetical protein